MAHTGNPFGGGAAGGGNPYGAGGQQPVQHRRDCREPYRNPCANPCGPDDDGDDVLDVVLDEGGTGDGSGFWPGGGGGRGGRDGRDGRGDSARGDGPAGGQGGSSSGSSDRGPSGDPTPGSGASGDANVGGSGGNSGGDKDGCGCMPGGGKGGGGGGRNGDGCFGGGGGGGSRGGGGGDGCGGCDPCLLRIVLVLPFVVLWAALRALIGRPIRTAAHTKPLPQTDRVLPQGRAARTLFRAVRWYRLSVSPRKPEPVCRYTPSCSTYAAQSLQRHGAWRGTRLTLRRLSRCNPRHHGGHDPVPQRGN